MVPIEIDASRGEQLVEVEREHALRGYDIYTNRMPGSVVKTNDSLQHTESDTGYDTRRRVANGRLRHMRIVHWWRYGQTVRSVFPCPLRRNIVLT